MTIQTLSGGQAIVQGLLAHGVDTVFGLPGAQVYGLFDAFKQAEPALRTIGARHEQGVGYMAFGYARASGRPGVYAVVPGPGFLNASAALLTARRGHDAGAVPGRPDQRPLPRPRTRGGPARDARPARRRPPDRQVGRADRAPEPGAGPGRPGLPRHAVGPPEPRPPGDAWEVFTETRPCARMRRSRPRRPPRPTSTGSRTPPGCCTRPGRRWCSSAAAPCTPRSRSPSCARRCRPRLCPGARGGESWTSGIRSASPAPRARGSGPSATSRW
ncbi:MAG: thiamine pyrophosphate-binding protein [Caulobacteraceae bacterium]